MKLPTTLAICSCLAVVLALPYQNPEPKQASTPFTHLHQTFTAIAFDPKSSDLNKARPPSSQRRRLVRVNTHLSNGAGIVFGSAAVVAAMWVVYVLIKMKRGAAMRD